MRTTLPIPFALLLSAASLLSAQQVGTNARNDEASVPTLSMSTQLVIETVEVKDKKGNFIDGLAPKDFNVTEDGAPQIVKIFELQHLSTAAEPMPPLGKDQENITIYKRLTHTQIAPEPKENSKYKDHRLLALYFDMTTMTPQDQMRAFGAAMKFVRTQMSAADMIAIMRFNGGAVDILQDFTADRNRLLSILETLVVGEGQGNSDSIDDAASADTGTAFGQDDSEFNIFNTDRQLSALQTAAHMLAQMSEKKSLIYFASGLRLNGVDNIAQLHATVDEAIRAGVSFWPVDTRGLVANAPLGDATQANAGNANMYNGTGAQASNDRLQQSQDTLFSLAGDTGGKALLDNNDLTQGIVLAQQAIRDYYIVGYYSTNSAQNGHFRKVKITANTPVESALNYRQGYYAGKEFGKFNVADKERQLEDALMLGDPITDLTIAMEVDYFQLNRAEYYVPFVVKIPGRELALAKHFGAEHTLIDFICEIKDEVSGFTVSNVRDFVNIKLSDATAADLAHRPIEYDSGFTLLPGRYSIKFLARDDETGRIGTYQTSFVIPNLNKEAERVPLSSVVIGGERKDLKDVLYDALKAKDRARDEAANPLVFDGKKLIPSVTRVFHKDRPIYLVAQAYAHAMAASATAGSTTTTAAPTPMLAYLTLSRDGKKQLETVPVAATPASGNRLGMIPFHLTMKADQLEPGQYQCQFTVLDPANGRASFRIFPIELVQ